MTSSFTRLLCLTVLYLAALGGLARAARAQGVLDMEQDMEQEGADERAKAHFRVGKSLYDSGRFAEAAEEWQEAYALSSRPELLYNIYVAYRDASETPKAVDALRRYLETADVEPIRRVNLEARLRAMEQSLAASQPAGQAPPPGAEAPAGASPRAQPAPPPGPALEASEGQLEISGGADSVRQILPYALIGVGGSMVVASVVTGLVTASKTSQIEDDCPHETCPAGYDLDKKRDQADTLALVTDVLWIGGAALAGLGATWVLVGGADGETQAGAHASVGCTPGSCAAAVHGRF